MARTSQYLILGICVLGLAGCGSASAAVRNWPDSHSNRAIFHETDAGTPGAEPSSTPLPVAPTAVPQTSAPVAASTPQGVKIPSTHLAPPPLSSPPLSSPVFRNRLMSNDGSLDTSVGIYSDCSGRTPLSHAEAQIDTCETGSYFVGHNPGVFAPLLHMG